MGLDLQCSPGRLLGDVDIPVPALSMFCNLSSSLCQRRRRYRSRSTSRRKQFRGPSAPRLPHKQLDTLTPTNTDIRRHRARISKYKTCR